MARRSIPPVDDPEVIRRVVAVLNAHRPARVTRPNPARDVGTPGSQAVAA